MDAVALTVREDGLRAVLTASRPDDGRGLHKAWLFGPNGRFLLGTMAPEGTQLVIRRTISVAELKRYGVWPPDGAETELAFSFSDSLPPGWRAAEGVADHLEDRALAGLVRGLTGGLIYTDRGGFFLAAPYSPTRPFPLSPLFCFAVLEELGQSCYAIFCFDRDGRPCFSHNRPEETPY